MSDLLELASRVEAADGPSRDIDLSIMRYAENIGGPAANASPYTASLDAAMQLVPEGWRWGVEMGGQFDSRDVPDAWCWPFDSSFDPDWQMGQQGYRDAPEGKRACAATPALALCAAALRARAATTEGEVKP